MKNMYAKLIGTELNNWEKILFILFAIIGTRLPLYINWE